MKWRLLYFKILEEVVFFKSWLIFYRFGLKASLMRASMMSTFFEHVVRYVPRFGDLEEWKFNEVFYHPPANDLSVEEAAFEMYEYYKYWMERTFNGESFEVFDTLDGRGLGIYSSY